MTNNDKIQQIINHYVPPITQGYHYIEMLQEYGDWYVENSNYKIIHDEQALLDFIDWLPDLKENEVFYLMLMSRKKYCPELIKSNDKSQLKRFTSTKERLVDKIRQLEIPLGRYKIGGIDAPQESLVLYINPNPRCMKKATKLMGKRCWELNDSNGYNLHQEAMSCIQQSKSYSYVIDFDIDTKDVDLTELWKNIFPDKTWKSIPIYDVLETRGGYHLLVKPDVATMSIRSHNSNHLHQWSLDWYKRISKLYPVDQSNDQLLPVVGACQGNWIPKFINI